MLSLSDDLILFKKRGLRFKGPCQEVDQLKENECGMAAEAKFYKLKKAL